MPSHQWVVIKAVVEKRRAIRFRLTASRALHLRFVFMVNPPSLPLLLREEVKRVCFIWEGGGFKASHDSESSFPGIKTLGFFQSVVVAGKEALQPDSHSLLTSNPAFVRSGSSCRRERGRALGVGELQRAGGSGQALPHTRRRQPLSICSATAHHPQGLPRRDTPAGCGAGRPLLPRDGAGGTRWEAGSRDSHCLPPPSSSSPDLGDHCSVLTAEVGRGEASHLSPKKNRYLEPWNTFCVWQKSRGLSGGEME